MEEDRRHNLNDESLLLKCHRAMLFYLFITIFIKEILRHLTALKWVAVIFWLVFVSGKLQGRANNLISECTIYVNGLKCHLQNVLKFALFNKLDKLQLLNYFFFALGTQLCFNKWSVIKSIHINTDHMRFLTVQIVKSPFDL